MPLAELTFIALDSETAGLSPLGSRLIELGAVRFRVDGSDITTFSQLIDPGEPIPPDAQRVHGITDMMVRGQCSLAEVLPRFLEFLGSPQTILLAHDARFDLQFLAIAIVRLGLPPLAHRMIDTRGLARTLCPSLPSYTLEVVAQALGICHGGLHRALPDALLVKEVFQALLRGQSAPTSLADLLAVSPPLSFADAQVFPLDPSPALGDLGVALAKRCPLRIVYAGGLPESKPRTVTPSVLLQWRGIAYLAAWCHRDRKEKLFRLDRIRQCWLDGGSL